MNEELLNKLNQCKEAAEKTWSEGFKPCAGRFRVKTSAGECYLCLVSAAARHVMSDEEKKEFDDNRSTYSDIAREKVVSEFGLTNSQVSDLITGFDMLCDGREGVSKFGQEVRRNISGLVDYFDAHLNEVA